FRVVSLSNDNPGIIGVYIGKTKPESSSNFFKYFVEEFHCINAAIGIEYKNKRILIFIRAFIADASARVMVLNHRGHNSTNPCSKCKVTGNVIDRTMCSPCIMNTPRTDAEYFFGFDKSHQLDNCVSPLKY
ncbi:hypothetical protein PV325_014136, partial [Microctonus aethiopoides]